MRKTNICSLFVKNIPANKCQFSEGCATETCNFLCNGFACSCGDFSLRFHLHVYDISLVYIILCICPLKGTEKARSKSVCDEPVRQQNQSKAETKSQLVCGGSNQQPQILFCNTHFK